MASIPSFALSRLARAIYRYTGTERLGGTADLGYLHCGPSGAGHFVKMVHNGIEYGLMAAYAEGLEFCAAPALVKIKTAINAETAPAARSVTLPLRTELARHSGGLVPRKRHCFLAARLDCSGAN